MHYGHPDVFDRIFHITRGGISKASRVINISEDIYAGKLGGWQLLVSIFKVYSFFNQLLQLVSFLLHFFLQLCFKA